MKQKSKIKKQQESKKACLPARRGFSLIETLIAIFVFSLAMAMVVGAFSSFYKTYVNSKKIQRDVESAQYAMNLMAKTLRTSSVVAVNASPMTAATTFDFYDYSQSSCIRYTYDPVGKILRSGTQTGVASPAACNYPSISPTTFTGSIVNPSVIATPTAGAVLGKVTVSLSVQSGISLLPIQMSVSLRQ